MYFKEKKSMQILTLKFKKKLQWNQSLLHLDYNGTFDSLKCNTMLPYIPEAPSLFGTRDWFCGRQFFHRLGRRFGFGMIQVHHTYCALNFYFNIIIILHLWNASRIMLFYTAMQEVILNWASVVTAGNCTNYVQVIPSGNSVSGHCELS